MKRGNKERIAKKNGADIPKEKSVIVVYIILRILVLGVLIRCIFLRQWESVFTCLLTLVLLMLPTIIERSLKINLPSALEITALVMVFCAEILGEIGSYYVKVKIWDTAMHTTSGFMFAAFGFCIVDLMNRSKNIRMELSPATLAVVAFCFSMTIGVLWEFFEFGVDQILHHDMQKDFLINSIHSVALDPTKTNTVIHVNDIVSTVITTASGETVTMSGYLDVGIIDTMKDLLVNFIGALVFSVLGFFYVKHRGKGKIAPKFIPVIVNEENSGEKVEQK